MNILDEVGFRDAIYTPSIYKQLKSYLSDDRINDLKKTTRSAYYTPELLVKFIWSTLSIIGFKGGKILEPAVGHMVCLLKTYLNQYQIIPQLTL